MSNEVASPGYTLPVNKLTPQVGVVNADFKGGAAFVGLWARSSAVEWTAEGAVRRPTSSPFVALSTFILSFSTTVAVETSSAICAERFPTQ
jgi:hypothetical protein